MVADACGAAVGHLARAAAVELTMDEVDSSVPLGTRLLGIIRGCFNERDRMGSQELVTAMEWVDLDLCRKVPGYSSELNPRILATELRQYGVRPRDVRIDGAPPVKGYYKADFEDAWQRYLNA